MQQFCFHTWFWSFLKCNWRAYTKNEANFDTDCQNTKQKMYPKYIPNSKYIHLLTYVMYPKIKPYLGRAKKEAATPSKANVLPQTSHLYWNQFTTVSNVVGSPIHFCIRIQVLPWYSSNFGWFSRLARLLTAVKA